MFPAKVKKDAKSNLHKVLKLGIQCKAQKQMMGRYEVPKRQWYEVPKKFKPVQGA